MKKLILAAILLISFGFACTAFAKSPIQQAADNIESAIHHAMKSAGRAGNPTLSQLGGVQSGSTSHDAGGDGAGGGSSQSSSSGSSSSGSTGGSSGGASGSAGGDPCFVAGTMIAMADGSAKAIEQLVVGDKVISCDPATAKTYEDEVSATQILQSDHVCTITFEDASQLELTDNHPLWAKVNDKTDWAAISPKQALEKDGIKTMPLKAGDYLYVMSGEWVRIAKIQRTVGQLEVHNITVREHHTYFVSAKMMRGGSPRTQYRHEQWLLTHNSCGQGDSPGR
ncbi:Hint domain-containing protein [Maridesulfovibrio sp.]|uniref:Hint domain-containing protein n=1 Tax=Maridesulfovibrio sp. TaxID=2795000 RepID=UPI0029CA0AD8|nr:Hint domain-containing protein [Maridesulfovibrio sp.]